MDAEGNYERTALEVRDRVAVLKVKYLYFF
jgi:hypothetical protein